MSKKVSNPNAKGGSGFIWAIVAALVIAAVVIGYVVYSGQGQRTAHLSDRENVSVDFDSEYSDSAVTLKSASAGADAEVVDLYEDYSCNFCASLAENTDEQMKAAIESGDLVVNLRTLNFLDRGNTEGHSTAAAAAVLAVADSGDTDLYWNVREVLLAEQAEIYNKWSSDDFADAVAALGGSDQVVDDIRNGAYQAEAESVTQANSDLLEESTGDVSSPRVLQDGEDVPVEDINQWIDAVLQG